MNHYKSVVQSLSQLVVLPLFAACLAFGQGLSAGTWTTPSIIGENSSIFPNVAVDLQGNAVAVWVQSDDNGTWIQGASQSFGGAWTLTDPLSSTVPLVEFPRQYPSLVINQQSGDAIAVWNSPVGDQDIILTATLPFESTSWTTPTQLLATPASIIAGPSLGIDSQGNILAVWGTWKKSDETSWIESARFDFGTQSWQQVTPIAMSQNFDFLVLGVSAAGIAVMVWCEGGEVLPTAVVSTTLSSDSLSWDTPQTVFSGSGTFASRLGVDSQGNAVAVWFALDSSEKHWSLQASTLGANDSAWQQTQFPTAPGDVMFLDYLDLVVDQAGNALVAWQPKDSKNVATLQTSILPSKKTAPAWTTPVNALPAGDSIRYGALGVDSAGNVLFVWERDTSWQKKEDGMLQAITLPFQSTAWTTPVKLATIDMLETWPQVALSPQNSCVVLFPASNYPLNTVQAINGFNVFKAVSKKKLVRK